MADLYYLDGVEESESIANETTESGDSAVSSTGTTNTQSATSNASANEVIKLATRVESLEKYVQDLQNNVIRKNSDATLNSLTIKDRISAWWGKVGGWLIDSGKLISSGIEIDSNNSQIKSTDYASDAQGFIIRKDLIEATNIRARGSLQGTTFSYDIVSAIGGQLLVANADVLAEDMSSLDNSVLAIKGDTTFAVNDILLIRGVATSGIQEEYFRVTAVSGDIYTVTRDLAGSFSSNENPTWKKGTPVVKVGSSDGVSTYSGGWLRLIGEGTNSPYYSVFARTGVAYNDYTEVARFGNLNGFINYITDKFGIAIGDSNSYLTYDPTNGLRVTDSQILFKFTAGENLTAGDAVQVGFNIEASEKKATNDTYFVQAQPDTNFGNDTSLIIKATGGDNIRAFVKFDLSDNLPTKNLTSAKFYVKANGSYQSADTLTLVRCTSSWAEGTLTYNNQPTVGSSFSTFTPPWNAGEWGYAEMYEQVLKWIDGTDTNYGFRIDGNAGGTYNNFFPSEVSGKEPYLVLTYSTDKVFKASARNATNAGKFLGFVKESVSEGDEALVVVSNVFTTTGLTAGVPYYLSDTRGSISTSAGSISKKVGIALSTTKLLIQNS